MLVSALLAVAAVAAILVQWLSMPSTFVPLLLGIGALLAAVVLGLAKGSRLYRAAVLIALVAFVAIGLAIMVPWDRGAAGPRPNPTRGEIVLALGVSLAALSAVLGAVALWRQPRGAPASDDPAHA